MDWHSDRLIFELFEDLLTLDTLLPGLGTLLLAMISGAGGAILLEVWWRPRRSRRRAATLIHADLMINGQLITAHAELRKRAPRKVPQDLKLSRLGFDRAGGMVCDLPAHILRRLVLIYVRIDELNRCVDLYADALEELEGLEDDAPNRRRVQAYLNTVLDTWNFGLDRLWDLTREVAEPLERLAKVEKGKGESIRNIREEARAHMKEREERLRALNAMDDDA